MTLCPFSTELAALFRRDLTRLHQQISAFPDESSLWSKPPGISNSAGNLALHLEGNLREYIGRQLGHLEYTRNRPVEFNTTAGPVESLVSRLAPLPDLIAQVVESLTPEAMDALYPEPVLGAPIATRQFLCHLLGHLNYHLGQIDYLRRILTEGQALKLAEL